MATCTTPSGATLGNVGSMHSTSFAHGRDNCSNGASCSASEFEIITLERSRLRCTGDVPASSRRHTSYGLNRKEDTWRRFAQRDTFSSYCFGHQPDCFGEPCDHTSWESSKKYRYRRASSSTCQATSETESVELETWSWSADDTLTCTDGCGAESRRLEREYSRGQGPCVDWPRVDKVAEVRRGRDSGVPVYVMLPLDTVNSSNTLSRPRAIAASLSALKSAGVEGVMCDVWWGIVEKEGPGQYNWSAYAALIQFVKDAGLKLQAVMSFHKCGGNVGDHVE